MLELLKVAFLRMKKKTTWIVTTTHQPLVNAIEDDRNKNNNSAAATSNNNHHDLYKDYHVKNDNKNLYQDGTTKNVNNMDTDYDSENDEEDADDPRAIMEPLMTFGNEKDRGIIEFD